MESEHILSQVYWLLTIKCHNSLCYSQISAFASSNQRAFVTPCHKNGRIPWMEGQLIV